MENKIPDRRVAITAGLGIAALAVLLLAMIISGNIPDAGILGAAFAAVVILTAVAVAKKTKKRALLFAGVVLGIIMFIAGVVLGMFAGTMDFSAMTVGGLVMIIICGMSLRRPKDYDVRDERALKIGTWAISYSWYLAFLTVILMFWLSYFNIAELTVQIVLGILMFLMPLSAVLFQWYFSKKGDVY